MVALTPDLVTHGISGERAVLNPAEDAAINAVLTGSDVRTQLLYILTRGVALEFHQIANLRVCDLWDAGLGKVKAAIDIPPSSRCTLAHQRTIPDNVRAQIAVLAGSRTSKLLQTPDALLFTGRESRGGPFCRSTAFRIISEMGTLAGVPGLSLRVARTMGAQDFFNAHGQDLAATAQWLGHTDLGTTGQLIGSTTHTFTRQARAARNEKGSRRKALNHNLTAQVKTLKTEKALAKQQLQAARARECKGLKEIKRLRKELVIALTLTPPGLIPKKPWWRHIWPESVKAA